MSNDEPTPEQEAEMAALAEAVERESARVGVDWEAASERLRALVEQEWVQSEDGESMELTLGMDIAALLHTLRRLPDGAGTERFLAAFEEDNRAGGATG